ncbi:MAG: hypothetical protein J6W64_02910, partial [Bacilli bacterium]|nr:hypothetical protein [Bacilli bacterium]
IFNKNNKDLRKRIYFTLACLGIFCLGTTITIPWAKEITDNLGFLEIFNLMSGGGLRSFSIFALGVSPYITAQIITQLLQMDILPYFKELKDQGYTGRQKINKITRYLGIIFAFIQAYAIIIFYMKGATSSAMLKTAITMTAGTSFLLWIGDQITQKGIGNGQSLLIMAGIVQSMPNIFKSAFQALVTSTTYSTGVGSALFAGFCLLYLIIIIGIIWVTLAERRIPIQYANRTASAYGAKQSFLPIKINSAGVMPVIFASILTTIPATVVQLIGKKGAINFVNKYIIYTTPVGFLIYIGLTIIFKDTFKNKLKKDIEKVDTNGIVNYTSTFSGQKFKIAKEDFKGAEINSIFGGVDLDLREAKIKEDIVIKATCIFGGADIFLPDDVNVKVDSTSLFGGVEDKRRDTKDDCKYTVYIQSTCIFGGVEIK